MLETKQANYVPKEKTTKKDDNKTEVKAEQKEEKAVKKLVSKPLSNEDLFVEAFVSTGNSLLEKVKKWEPTHTAMKLEHAKENSFMNDEKMKEVLNILRLQPTLSLNSLDKMLNKYGMGLSISNKILLLRSHLDILKIKSVALSKERAEFISFGVGQDPTPSIERIVKESDKIQKEIEALEAEYRKFYPKGEVFK